MSAHDMSAFMSAHDMPAHEMSAFMTANMSQNIDIPAISLHAENMTEDETKSDENIAKNLN